MGRAIDLFVTYRFIKLLVTPFEDTPAFKLGIIDKNGKIAETFSSITNPSSKKFIKALEKLI